MFQIWNKQENFSFKILFFLKFFLPLLRHRGFCFMSHRFRKPKEHCGIHFAFARAEKRRMKSKKQDQQQARTILF